MNHEGVRPSRHELGHGLQNLKTAYWNLGTPQLLEKAIQRQEGQLAANGAFVVRTGQFTGRSPKDKYIVLDAGTESTVNWGPVNQSMTPEKFDGLFARMLKFWEGKDAFVLDCFGGTDAKYRLPVRVIAQRAWHAMFGHDLFVRPTAQEIASHVPEVSLFFAPEFAADPALDGVRSNTAIVINFAKKIVLIAGTEYAGEMKKSIFTILNYLLTFKNVAPMHCSANMDDRGRVAVFFGLSGTGKTTLSADPSRKLIGDDEHGWSDRGVFNFEGGCYAKCIKLSKEKEPQIWNAIRFGTVLENVKIDAESREPDFDSDEYTENTRAAYPIEYIENAELRGYGGHPTHVLLLTADAFGVLPPISRLTPEQTMYHFLSGYTAKLAGTERGLGKEPAATFSACFGEPFLPRQPQFYAKMLGEKIAQHNVHCYLVNTGWVGGPYGVGERMNLKYTRAMVNACIAGQLDNIPADPHPVFRVMVPRSVPGVPSELLDARGQWKDKAAYDRAAEELSARFKKNFEKFGMVAEEIMEAAPA